MHFIATYITHLARCMAHKMRWSHKIIHRYVIKEECWPDEVQQILNKVEKLKRRALIIYYMNILCTQRNIEWNSLLYLIINFFRCKMRFFFTTSFFRVIRRLAYKSGFFSSSNWFSREWVRHFFGRDYDLKVQTSERWSGQPSNVDTGNESLIKAILKRLCVWKWNI